MNYIKLITLCECNRMQEVPEGFAFPKIIHTKIGDRQGTSGLLPEDRLLRFFKKSETEYDDFKNSFTVYREVSPLQARRLHEIEKVQKSEVRKSDFSF